MSVFNVTENMTNLVELLPLASGYTQGFLGLIIFIVVVAGVALIFRGSKEGLLAAGVVGFVIAPILKYLDLVGDWVWFLSLIILIISFFSVASSKGGGT